MGSFLIITLPTCCLHLRDYLWAKQMTVDHNYICHYVPRNSQFYPHTSERAQARSSMCVCRNATHFVLWMRFIRVNPVNLKKWPIACLLIILLHLCDISMLEGPWPSNTSQHSPVASQPKIDQLILLGVTSSWFVLLSPLKRQRVRTKSLLVYSKCSYLRKQYVTDVNGNEQFFTLFPIKSSIYDTI
jgi:hypothetical protein